MLRNGIWLALTLAATPAAGQSNVSISEEVRYYDVHGTSLNAIGQSLLRDAPAEIEGFQGYTQFVYSWQYRYDMRGGVCDVFGTAVDIEITIHLPRHPDVASAPKDVRKAWGHFATSMELHERQHAADFKAMGARLPAGVDAVEAPTCDDIEDIANAKGMDYVDMAQAESDEFDRYTQHGMKQGTLFPGL